MNMGNGNLSVNSPLLDRLASAPMVGDGAMGTHLYELGYDIRLGPERLSVTVPEAVRQIHDAYVEAGAELLETNTFAANRISLNKSGLGDQTAAINSAATRLALASAGRRAWVAGSIGPVAITPLDDSWDASLARAAYREQAEILCNCGVHALMLETFNSLEAILPALEECQNIASGRIPVIAQMVFADGIHAPNASPSVLANRLIDGGATVVGANCGRGLQSIRPAIDELLSSCSGKAFVSVYPNAGYPEQIGGRTVYLATPAYIATQSTEWARRGVRLLGGCCGTTPDTIRAIKHALSSLRRFPVMSSPVSFSVLAQATVSLEEKNFEPITGGFLDDAKNIRYPVIAEIDPPPHLEWQPVLQGAKSLLDSGAHAISLAENPLASVRMDNFFIGAKIREATGRQVICHITCRDRNSIGMQSALMGAHAAGIEAVLAVTGDPTVNAGHNKATSVYEMNSLSLVRLATGLNRGQTAAGRDLRGATNFSIGVAFNSAAANLAAEAARLRRKCHEGARFVMTQPVFDLDQAKRVLDVTQIDGIRVFLGLLPPISLKMAVYLHNEVPGIKLNEAILSKLQSLQAIEDQEKFGIDVITSLIDKLASFIDGLYFITPGTRWRCLLPLLEQVNTMR